MLAALVPERVLPFASGGSRKRGLSRAEVKKTSDAAVGRREASAPAPFFEVPATSVFPQWGRQENGRAPHRFSMRPGGCAYRRSASLLSREEFWRTFWRGFLGFKQNSDAKRIAGTD